MRPADLKYTKSHEWVRIEKDIATTGITDFAVAALSDLVYVDMPAITDLLEQGQPFAEVESVKAVSDVVSPVSGEVVEVNQAVVDAPETVNDDPYGTGWLIRVRLSDPSELDALLDVAAYTQVLADQ